MFGDKFRQRRCEIIEIRFEVYLNYCRSLSIFDVISPIYKSQSDILLLWTFHDDNSLFNILPSIFALIKLTIESRVMSRASGG